MAIHCAGIRWGLLTINALYANIHIYENKNKIQIHLSQRAVVKDTFAKTRVIEKLKTQS